jgi:hypothetical protein
VLHVLNGDATRVSLELAGLPGTFAVWADALHEGPVPDGVSEAELRELRVRHFAAILPFNADGLRETVTAWDAALERYSEHDEVVFWFEHDLFDQLILIRHLHWLSTLPRGSAKFSLICIGAFPGLPNFHGLGELTPEQLATLFPQRAPISGEQLALGMEAWNRFRAPTPHAFARLLHDNTSVLPFLAGAVRRHLEDYPSRSTGLSRSERQMLEAIAQGAASFGEIFVACQRMEERVYMGDSIFRAVLDGLANARHPLVSFDANGRASATPTGTSVLAGQADHVSINGIDRWMGGVHLTPGNLSRAEELLRVR